LRTKKDAAAPAAKLSSKTAEKTAVVMLMAYDDGA
jgi:hypothetical protein